MMFDIEGETGYQSIGDTFNRTGDKYFGSDSVLTNPKVVADNQVKLIAAVGVSLLVVFYAWKKL